MKEQTLTFTIELTYDDYLILLAGLSIEEGHALIEKFKAAKKAAGEWEEERRHIGAKEG